MARVERLTPTIVEVVVRAPAAARHFQPGQFFRLQNFEALARTVERHAACMMEGLALTGAWVDKAKGLLSLIVLEMGGSSRLCAGLEPGEPVVVMGPTGTPTEIPQRRVGRRCAGGGLGNAVLFSIGKALRARGNRVLYFAAYRKREDIYKIDEIEAAADQIVWSVDGGELPDAAPPAGPRLPRQRRAGDARPTRSGELGEVTVPLADCAAHHRHRQRPHDGGGEGRAPRRCCAPHFKPDHVAIASINSPMQCMMKEICAQCLQRHIDPVTGKETIVFSCSNQDQPQDAVDWKNLADRLRQNTVQEKLTDRWVQRLLAHER